jgi:hypothetical protein
MEIRLANLGSNPALSVLRCATNGKPLETEKNFTLFVSPTIDYTTQIAPIKKGWPAFPGHPG